MMTPVLNLELRRWWLPIQEPVLQLVHHHNDRTRSEATTRVKHLIVVVEVG